MITRSQKIRLGIFSVVAVSILIITLFLLSIDQFIEDQDVYYIAYEDVSVSGLDVGSPVKYLGLKVGSVKKIKIDPRDISRIIVQVGLTKDTPIKKDVEAEISTIGITGLKLIELRGGTNEAELLKPGRFIKAGESFTDVITGKAEIIAEKIEHALNNLIAFTSSKNQEKFSEAFGNASETISNVNDILSDNKAGLTNIISNIEAISNEMRLIGSSTRETMETISQVVQSDTIKQTIARISSISQKMEESDIYNLIDNLNTSVTKINRILGVTEELVIRNRITLMESIDEFRETSMHLRNAARLIDENPAILITGTSPVSPPDDLIEE